MKKVLLTTLILLASVGMTGVVQARDQIKIVGSSTVYPFSTTVAERFGKTTNFKTPVVESTGSGGGFKLFCAGNGTEHPDFTNASRAIKKSEIELCAKNGVKNIQEVEIGFDGIVIANARDAYQFNLSLKDVFLALAKYIPDENGKLIENPNVTWKDIRSDLPAVKIEVLGPPPTSGTRDAFVELAMEGGAKQIPFLKDLRKTDKKKFKTIAHSLREDGMFIEAGENDNLIVQKLVANHSALGIFGFSFLDNNGDVVKGTVINENKPTFENISSGDYPLSRPLFFYVKTSHIGKIPGIQEYVDMFVSDSASGDEGYLTDKGLIPLPEDKRTNMVREIK